jgi:hypothetical protein
MWESAQIRCYQCIIEVKSGVEKEMSRVTGEGENQDNKKAVMRTESD